MVEPSKPEYFRVISVHRKQFGRDRVIVEWAAQPRLERIEPLGDHLIKRYTKLAVPLRGVAVAAFDALLTLAEAKHLQAALTAENDEVLVRKVPLPFDWTVNGAWSCSRTERVARGAERNLSERNCWLFRPRRRQGHSAGDADRHGRTRQMAGFVGQLDSDQHPTA
jgi:hypothetical protein